MDKQLNSKKAQASVTLSMNIMSVKCEKKIKVLYTPTAWLKMHTLVQQTPTEVAWHGIVDYNRESNTILVDDILVYPQEVSGGTVDSIDEEYGPWLMALDQKVFERLRMQGHSHVNMGVGASGTDRNYYDNVILPQLKDYYLFIILNKRGEVYAEFYDIENNLMYEDKDIEHDLLLQNYESLDAWYKSHENIINNKAKRKVLIDTTLRTQEDYWTDEQAANLKRWREAYGYSETY